MGHPISNMISAHRASTRWSARLVLSVSLLIGAICDFGMAQAPPPASPPAADLSGSKQQVFRDYERFEKSLFDVAEQVRRKDPERAELLYRARAQSQEQNILAEMRTIAELLRTRGTDGSAVTPQLGPAADRQAEIVARLESVLKVLQSLDERERVAAEIARVQDLLKETNRIIARQKDIRAETQRGRQPERTLESQKKVTDEVNKLADKIDEQDAKLNAERSPDPRDRSPKGDSEKSPDGKQDGKPGDPQQGKPGEQKPDDKKSGEPMPGDQDSGDKKPDGKKSDGKKSDGKNSEKDNPTEKGDQKSDSSQQGQPQDSQGQPDSPKSGDEQPKSGAPQQGSKPSDQSQSPQQSGPKTAGREELEQARQQMQQAIEELEAKKQQGALENQDNAVRKLEELKAQLEEILRQLREDERESYLTLLEARFQNMLRRQQHINSETVRLDAIPVADRVRQNVPSQIENLRKEQDDNSLEAEKAAHLLKEEGSSVAFPEAVEQMHENMRVVVSRLSKQEIGGTTQLVEQLIVETLEEMITALRKELQKKQDEQKQGPQGGQPGGPQDPSLVDQIAELKLIRSLQTQINRLTKQIGTELDGKLPGDPAQINLIQDIRLRQERIQKATYDLSVGRNE